MGKIQDCKIVRGIKSTIAWVLEKVKNNIALTVLVVGAMFALLAPWIVTRVIVTGSAWFDWADFAKDIVDKGQIGDLIGGTTAPILNFMGSILVFLAFRSQIKANKDVQNQFAEDQKERLLKFYSDLFDEWIGQFTKAELNPMNKNRKGLINNLPNDQDIEHLIQTTNTPQFDAWGEHLKNIEVLIESTEQLFSDFEESIRSDRLIVKHAKIYFQIRIKPNILGFNGAENECMKNIGKIQLDNETSKRLRDLSDSFCRVSALLEKIESEFK